MCRTTKEAIELFLIHPFAPITHIFCANNFMFNGHMRRTAKTQPKIYHGVVGDFAPDFVWSASYIHKVSFGELAKWTTMPPQLIWGTRKVRRLLPSSCTIRFRSEPRSRYKYMRILLAPPWTPLDFRGKSNAGCPWSEEEHRDFLSGLQSLGKVSACHLLVASSHLLLPRYQRVGFIVQGNWRGISRMFVPSR